MDCHVIGDIAREFGMSRLAKASGISLEHLYTALSERSNPSIKAVSTIMSCLGFRIRFERRPVVNSQAPAMA